MSLKKNIFVNFVTQIYVTLIGILILPIYLKYMGAEAYGLVGFFTMLQTWFNLLDIGLTPTVARETARFQGGATDALSYRRLFRALQIIFVAIALMGGCAVFFSSELIAVHWLNVQTLPMGQVENALQLMALGIAFRWMSGLYRGCVTGAECLVWLGGFNAIVASLRFLGVLPVLIWVGHTPTIFFSYQLLVAFIEMAGLAIKSRRLMPATESNLGWAPKMLFAPIRPVLKFSLSIAFISSVWVLVTQTDKLLLSKMLSLADYGYFTLAVLAASGVMMISGPISSALMPRMTNLQARGDEKGLFDLYRNATQMVAIIAIPACLTLFFFAEQVLWIWTGDASAAAHATPVLQLYAIGNGFLALSAFPYYLQYAKGDLKLHIIGNLIFMVVLIPSAIGATWAYGSIGAGYAWLCANGLYFFAWVPLVHKRFQKGLHKKWFLKDIAPVCVLGVFSVSIMDKFLVWPENRASALLLLLACSAAALAICGFASKRICLPVIQKLCAFSRRG